MSLDPYSYCPGGTGKKVKFCCSDMVGELDTIQRMLHGEQRLACLDRVLKAEAKHGSRPCLHAAKITLYAALEQPDEWQAAIDDFVKRHPENPAALAEAAIQLATQGQAREALAHLQRAVEGSATLSSRVADAFSVVAVALLRIDEPLAALNHLQFHAALGRQQEDHTALALLLQAQSSRAIPAPFKETALTGLDSSPAWKAEFDEALASSQRGAWQLAARKFEKLAAKAPREPAVWHNLAMLRGWLADRPGAVDAWRKFAALDVPLDDAVQAEVLAQLLDPPDSQFDICSLVYPIADMSLLEERLAGDRRAVRDPDREDLPDEDEPPPRAVYQLLDRPLPRTGVGLEAADVPAILAHLFLFGKQTDREARLEVTAFRRDWKDVKSALSELAFGTLGAAETEEPKTEAAGGSELSWQWRLPDDTPADHAQQLLRQKRQQALLETWPKAPAAWLQGKSPSEAAADPRQKIKLLAGVLRLESKDAEFETSVYDRLRTQLKLPLPGPIDPTVTPLEKAPLTSLHRVEIQKLSDDDLVQAYRRCRLNGVARVLHDVMLETLRRPAVKEQIGESELYRLLARTAPDPDESLSYLSQGRAADLKQGKSCAPWDLDELELLAHANSGAAFVKLAEHVQTQHRREPGAIQALIDLMVRLGLVNPEQVAAPGSPEPVAAAAPASKLWTPESAVPAGGGKKLWTPGG